MIGPAARRRLAGFARTLRDNGFKVGLAESRDAVPITRDFMIDAERAELARG